jgi:predicted lipoprotein with Yx(FWY)xxD motif
MHRPIAVASLVALTVALVAAGCGGDDSSSSSGAYGGKGSAATEQTSTASGGNGAAGGPASVSTADNPKLGRIIVDAAGLTLYDFHKDKGATSACYGACAQVWPPLLSEGAPQAKGDAEAAKLGTTKRKDGTTQVTYGGHPVYTYTADAKPGDAKGNDIDSFGAEWYALTPQGVEP